MISKQFIIMISREFIALNAPVSPRSLNDRYKHHVIPESTSQDRVFHPEISSQICSEN